MDDEDDRLDLSWSCASSFAGRNIWGKTTMYYNDQLLSNNNTNVKKEKKMRKWKQAYKEESFVDIKCMQQVSTFFFFLRHSMQTIMMMIIIISSNNWTTIPPVSHNSPSSCQAFLPNKKRSACLTKKQILSFPASVAMQCRQQKKRKRNSDDGARWWCWWLWNR